MISPLTAYKQETQKDKLRRTTFEYFNQKYFINPFVDEGFLETFERNQVRGLRFFIPGRVYTWSYDPITKDRLAFYDRQPMVLVHSQFISAEGNMIVQGLNLNFIPELQRVQTLEIFYNIYRKDLINAEKQIDNDEIGVLQNAWNFLTNWFFTIKMFNQQGKIGYQWAYRNYLVNRITRPVIIELEDSNLIPYFVPKEFEGKSPGEIWSEYLNVKGILNKKVPNKNRTDREKKRYLRPGK
jgi:hypothetical protein